MNVTLNKEVNEVNAALKQHPVHGDRYFCTQIFGHSLGGKPSDYGATLPVGPLWGILANGVSKPVFVFECDDGRKCYA